MPLRFFYFDMGNVLLKFDHEIACHRTAELTGLTPQRVRQIIFTSDLEDQYEEGKITSAKFHENFCNESGTKPSLDDLKRACSDIFWLNIPIVPIVAQLKAAGHRLGVLSNTCEAHWEFVTDGRYRIFQDFFDVFALSYEIKSMKPERAIYDVAATMAGVPAAEIFFVDDRADNVAGARAAGMDAVQFTTVAKLVNDLKTRKIRLNY